MDTKTETTKKGLELLSDEKLAELVNQNDEEDIQKDPLLRYAFFELAKRSGYPKVD